MEYRKLGNTGYDVSIVGFGTWQLGGQRWKGLSDRESVELLQFSLDSGINIYDVAVVYGQYNDEKGYLQSKSQELLGNAFSHQREKVIYCLKLGQFDEITHRHDYEPKRIIAQFQQSLRRLNTDFIDICLIHAPSIQRIKEGKAIAVLQTLQALGYIRAIGYSFEAEPEHVAEALKQPIDVIMLQYNLIDTICADAIESARLHGIGILAGGVFKRGYLSGEFREIDDLPLSDDYWQWNINRNKGKVESVLNEVNVLLDQYKTPENLRRQAITHVLRQPGVATGVIGHRHIQEIRENIRSSEGAELSLPDTTLTSIVTKQALENKSGCTNESSFRASHELNMKEQR